MMSTRISLQDILGDVKTEFVMHYLFMGCLEFLSLPSHHLLFVSAQEDMSSLFFSVLQ